MGKRLIGLYDRLVGGFDRFQVEDDLCYFPLCREVSCEYGSVEYLCEIYDASGR
jgi:hypothetical protein